MWNPERAKELLEREGRTRKWLARKCGVKVESLSLNLRGERNPGRQTIMLMAQALNCSPAELDDEFEALQVG